MIAVQLFSFLHGWHCLCAAAVCHVSEQSMVRGLDLVPPLLPLLLLWLSWLLLVLLVMFASLSRDDTLLQ